jgi:(1->4)-alpha-D-glucan 1-alpha-D-glucosylmutase
VPGSPHGYDVSDPTRLNPDVGPRRTIGRGLTRCVREAWVTCSTSCRTTWASPRAPTRGGVDVLENGACSRYAQFFDIEWHRSRTSWPNKVLIPILGDQYGAALERQELTLEYERGAFFVRHYDERIPIAPDTYSSSCGTRLTTG